MKFNEIIPGRQYQKSKVHDSATGKPRVDYKIYVLMVNDEEKKVLASIGGAPSKWCSINEYKYWNKREQIKEVV